MVTFVNFNLPPFLSEAKVYVPIVVAPSANVAEVSAGVLKKVYAPSEVTAGSLAEVSAMQPAYLLQIAA